MLFNSIGFIVFFPIVVLIYYLIPYKYRYLWLLAASYFFYGCLNIKYTVLLFSITLITYVSGWLIDKFREKKKPVLAACLIICLALLGVFKYFDFIFTNLNAVLGLMNIRIMKPAFSLILPVGISFYTFKSMGYVLDIYMCKIKPENNFLKYALFVSFFPQLIAGPIDRAKDLIPQIDEQPVFKEDDFRNGALLVLFGYYEKLLIADRMATLVNTVYDDYTSYSGVIIVLATVLYGIQIYCDFAGYSHIAIGVARMMGYKLMENFRQPYMATGIRDFWRRWHISMSSWFKDYLYFPLGGNRKGQVRKYINILITFLASGLWHGASWNFVVWGGLHGVYHLVTDVTDNFRNKAVKKYGISRQTFGHRFFQGLLTFALVDFAWLFFRAESLMTAVDMIRRTFVDFRLYSLTSEFIYNLGLSEAAVRSLPIAVLGLFVVDLVHENGISLFKWLDRQGIMFRWTCYISSVLLIILIAIQNLGQSTGEFIYFRF